LAGQIEGVRQGAAHLYQDERFSHVSPDRRLVILGKILDGKDAAESQRFLKKNVLPAAAGVGYKVIERRQYQREVTGLAIV
jgi:hypothetical protein